MSGSFPFNQTFASNFCTKAKVELLSEKCNMNALLSVEVKTKSQTTSQVLLGHFKTMFSSCNGKPQLQ